MKSLLALIISISSSATFCLGQNIKIVVESEISEDSLLNVASTRRLADSLKVLAWSDSMRSAIDKKYSENVVSRQLDSIRQLKMPTLAKQRKLDSISNRAGNLRKELDIKQTQLQEKLTRRYDDWANSLGKKLNSDSSGLRMLGVPSTSLPTNGLPAESVDVPSVPNTTIHSPAEPEIPVLNTLDFSELAMSEQLTNVNRNLSIPSMDQLHSMEQNITEFTGPLEEYKEKLAIAKGSLGDPSRLADEALTGVTEVNGVTGELNAAKAAQTNNEFMQTADQMKEGGALMEQLQNSSLDHFEEKEAAVQAAMTQLSKYKERYPSVGSLSEIKKENWLPKNGLKGVSFRNRIRYGLNFAFQNNRDTLLIDLYPTVSYRITGRFELGAGLMYRVKGVKTDLSVDQYRPVWGTSMFAVVKTFKAIYLRMETDATSYPVITATDGAPYRDWRWTFLSGIQTNFKLSRQLSGNLQMLYAFDKSLKDVFPDRLSLRFGIQYKLRPKAR